jgi:hypothetical protein
MKLGDMRAPATVRARAGTRADYHEFHFWLAVANQLGNLRAADKHMALAVDNSTTRGDHDLYAAKLDRMRAYEANSAAKMRHRWYAEVC